VQQGSRIARIAGQRADLVERRREGDDPVAAHPPVSRLHADDPRERRRLADRAARVGPDPEWHVIRRDGRRRPAAAAAGDAVEIPRIRRRPEGRVLRGRAHRELVHVRLAEDHGSSVAQALGDVRVVRGDIALQDPRASGALTARHRDEVLQGDWDSEKRVERRGGGRAIAAGRRKPDVGRVGFLERPTAVDRQPRVQGVVLALGDVQMRPDELAR
jgi:hypothetical protein